MRDNWRVTDSTSKVPKIKYFCLLSYKMNSNITEKLMISFVKVRILWADPFRNYGVRYKICATIGHLRYVGETSQKLRSRFNNHRNRLKKLTNLYLYHHFSSDGHSVDDMSIMPIEELTSNDRVSATSQRLEREDYWCRELCTYYPYGLNDNVRSVGNISKQHGLVVYTLFNKRQRKFRKRNGHKRRRKIDCDDLTSRFEDCMRAYKSHVFMFNVRSLILSLPKK